MFYQYFVSSQKWLWKSHGKFEPDKLGIRTVRVLLLSKDIGLTYSKKFRSLPDAETKLWPADKEAAIFSSSLERFKSASNVGSDISDTSTGNQPGPNMVS